MLCIVLKKVQFWQTIFIFITCCIGRRIPSAGDTDCMTNCRLVREYHQYSRPGGVSRLLQGKDAIVDASEKSNSKHQICPQMELLYNYM